MITEHEDIVEHLRYLADIRRHGKVQINPTLAEAADEIERLRYEAEEIIEENNRLWQRNKELSEKQPGTRFNRDAKAIQDENEAQRQAIRLLREELLEASNIIEGLISSRWMKKSLEPMVEKFRSIATDGV